MYDEVDSMLISVNVPKNLKNISNGRLRKVTEYKNDTKTFDWFVTNPINNYGLTKAKGEEKLIAAKNNIILRTSWLYSSIGHNFLNSIFPN